MTTLQRPEDAGMDPPHFLRVRICSMLGWAAAHFWLLDGSSMHRHYVVNWPLWSFSSACFKHLCLMESSWVLVILHVVGWSGGRAPLPRLCTLAGPLAQSLCRRTCVLPSKWSYLTCACRSIHGT